MDRILVVSKRLLQAIPTVFGIVVITFMLTRALPGDPAVFFAGPAATPESIAEIRSQLGLDQPWPVQFGRYLSDLAGGELGQSMTTGQPVMQELLRRLPASLELTLVALLLSLSVALPLGVLAATHQDTWIDQLCRFVVTAGVSLPTFFTGLLLVYLFYFLLGWAPPPLGRNAMRCSTLRGTDPVSSALGFQTGSGDRINAFMAPEVAPQSHAAKCGGAFYVSGLFLSVPRDSSGTWC
jgi:peptide/nickel transport system permease protein